MVIIKLLYVQVVFLNSPFICLISFCFLPQAGKVYHTYFITMKTEVQRGEVTPFTVTEIVNSKAEARNTTFGILAALPSTLSLLTNTALDQSQAVSLQPTRKTSNNIDVWAPPCRKPCLYK